MQNIFVPMLRKKYISTLKKILNFDSKIIWKLEDEILKYPYVGISRTLFNMYPKNSRFVFLKRKIYKTQQKYNISILKLF